MHALPLLATLAALVTVQAHPQQRRPPREAIEACMEKGAGDPCEFAGRQGQSVTGECTAPPDDAPDDAPLACRPDREPPTDRPPSQ
ncbi:MAG: hypothetical protein AAGF11_42300 [Myxococcota bacterium]